MKQQTAVDYLLEYCERENWSIPNNVIEHAKAMEKEQIVNAWIDGYDEDDRASSNPFKYYNETYGGNK